MAFLEAISRDLIKVPLTAKDGKGVIAELVSLYAAEKGLLPAQSESIIDAVMDRESLG